MGRIYGNQGTMEDLGLATVEQSQPLGPKGQEIEELLEYQKRILFAEQAIF